jgi:hypothetical protein
LQKPFKISIFAVENLKFSRDKYKKSKYESQLFEIIAKERGHQASGVVGTCRDDPQES